MYERRQTYFLYLPQLFHDRVQLHDTWIYYGKIREFIHFNRSAPCSKSCEGGRDVNSRIAFKQSNKPRAVTYKQFILTLSGRNEKKN